MIEDKVRGYIERHKLISDGERVGAAVSGGADSVCMLDILLSLGYDVCVLHFEHGIRTDGESERDMLFAEELCRARGIPFYCERADVPSLREKGESTESAARRLRYDFFARMCTEHGIDRVATAHHADDNAETFIFNLLRGSGMSGLMGISPKRAPNLIHPMLCLTRSEIDSYISAHSLSFVTDSTNSCTDYTRNKIRREILPLFSAINPEYSSAIARACELMRDDGAALDGYTGALMDSIAEKLPDGASIDIPALLAQPDAMQRRIVRAAISRATSLVDIERGHVESVLALAADPATGKSFEVGDRFRAFVSYNRLIIGKKSCKIVYEEICPLAADGVTPIFNGAHIECRSEDNAVYGDRHSLVQYIDADKAAGAVIRTRRSGDMFRPLGSPGKKKLKDYFIDEKIPADERDNVVLAAVGNSIIWAVGHGISEDIKVDANTRHIVRICYVPNENNT